jgi:hypothetical protein
MTDGGTRARVAAFFDDASGARTHTNFGPGSRSISKNTRTRLDTAASVRYTIPASTFPDSTAASALRTFSVGMTLALAEMAEALGGGLRREDVWPGRQGARHPARPRGGDRGTIPATTRPEALHSDGGRERR